MIKIKNPVFITSLIIVFIVYLITLAPGVVQIDSGELAAVASTLGIAHPTGYPLFTLIGYAFTKVFLLTSKIQALNLLSALYTLIGIIFVYKINYLLLKNFVQEKSIDKKKKKKSTNSIIDENKLKFISVIGAISVSFSKTFWLQSTSVEVYSLHIALISITLFLFLKAYYSSTNQELKQSVFKEYDWMLFAFFLGLSFTNHMTSILILPALGYFYFQKFRFTNQSIKRIFVMLIPCFVALTLYLYLPISASNNPEINWGNPINWENFKRHIMGWQYQSWIFSSTESASKQFKYFLSNYPEEFAYLGLILILIGVYTLFKSNKKILLFILLLFFTCVLYSINYDINDIDSYFLLAFISSGFLLTFGIYQLDQKFLKDKTNYGLFLIPLAILILNFEKVNQKDNTQFEEYTYSILDSVDKNSIVISYLWDFFISPSYYIQFVKNFRKDVSIIDKELVRRSWYFNQIKRNYPEIYDKSKHLIEGFLPELQKFERNQNYNPQILEKFYKEIILNFILSNINDRTVYLSPEMVTNEIQQGWIVIPDSLKLIPDLFLFKVVKDTSYQPIKNLDYKIHFKNKNDYYTETLKNLITTVHIYRAFYELKYGQKEAAKKLVTKSLEISPELKLPEELLNIE